MPPTEYLSTFTPETEAPPSGATSSGGRWRRLWASSLRLRLLSISLMPLLLTFPLVMAALLVLGGQGMDDILQGSLRRQLGASLNYLEQLRAEHGVRMGRLVRDSRVQMLLDANSTTEDRRKVLAEMAERNNLDYLVIVLADGQVLGSSNPVDLPARLPEDAVLRQARIGVTTAAFAKLPPSALAALGQALPAAASVPRNGGPDAVQDGLLIHAAAHFPLAVDVPDAVLMGGTLLNRHTTLMGHMRELIFPLGTLPDDSEGLTLLAADGNVVGLSEQRREGGRVLGMPLAPKALAALRRGDEQWLGLLAMGDAEYMAGCQRLLDASGQTIGAIGVAFPYAPYKRMIYLLLWSVGGVLALATVVVSGSSVVAARQLIDRLGRIVGTMSQVRRGERGARVATGAHQDELEHLALHFNRLLDTIEQQDAAQREAQKTIADEALRRRALFEHERDGVVIVNQDGSVFEANPAAARMLDRTPEQMQQLQLSDWDARYSLAEATEIVRSMGPEGATFESVLRRRDGSTFPAEVSLSKARWGNRTFTISLLRDISERKAAEEQIERYQENLARLVDQRTAQLNDRTEELNTVFAISPDGFVAFDRERRVASVNDAFTRMTGLSAADLKGMDEAAFSARLAALCARPESFAGVAHLRQRQLDEAAGADTAGEAAPVGRRWPLELAGAGQRVLEVALRLSESANVSQVLYVRDITHESEVDRMKSEFLSTAAHELRTPMASIYGFTELLLARRFSEEQKRDLLETIARQATRMSTIIDELLDLARIEARQGKDFVMEPVPLQALVDLVVKDYRPPEGRASPVITPCAASVTVHADRSKLQQAVLNVLSNAYKYSPDGGAVRIACAMEADGQHVRLSISDQGVGMTPEQCARVFERFYRVDDSGHIPGTGLGMSIVQEIIELHGGQVEVSSAPGAGTTVTLLLPVQSVAPALASVDDTAVSA